MISVCLATYNGQRFIERQLKSILTQLGADDEVVVADDGSTDDSANICEEYLSSLTHSFAHSFIRQSNSGVAAARNRGVAESHGEYLCFLDADDWWEPTFLDEIDKLITTPVINDDKFFNRKLQDIISGNDYKEVVNQAPRNWIIRKDKERKNIKNLSISSSF